MSNPEFHTCECGFTWRHGMSGNHSCSTYYQKTIAALQAQEPESMKLLRSLWSDEGLRQLMRPDQQRRIEECLAPVQPVAVPDGAGSVDTPIKKYLEERGEGYGIGGDHIHGFHKAPLLVSDIKTLIQRTEKAEAELEEWIHTNRIDELQRGYNAALARVKELESVLPTRVAVSTCPTEDGKTITVVGMAVQEGVSFVFYTGKHSITQDASGFVDINFQRLMEK